MVVFSALIAGSYSLGGVIANEIEPAALNAVRFFIATVIIGAIGLATGALNRQLLVAPWRFVVLGGLYATFFVLMFEALKTATAISTAAIFTLTPLVAGLFGWILLRQVTTLRMGAALAIGAAGAAWVIFRADVQALLAFEVGRGEVIFFWGMVSHAIYTPMARRLNWGENPVTMTFGMLVAGFLMLLMYGWSEIWATDWANLRPLVWITIAYISIMAGATSIFLVQFATLHLPSAKVMAYTYLTPSWVILWEVSLGHGAPGRLVMAGVGLTIVALLVLLKDEGQA